ncbi:MAG: GNAT family N-acetyltransferase [Bdellovibrionota bacterium]|nr:MAG: GNAT family N-acetyltransferase [Bdellovibrionota bacterium]
MQIRAASHGDIAPLAAIYVAAFKVVDPSERWTEARAAELLSFFLNAQPRLAFIAEIDGQAIGGICGLLKPWWDGAHLVETEIFVAPESQRRGVGQALLSHFIATAREKHGATIMESITFADLDFPASWYMRLGFKDKVSWRMLHGETETLAKQLRR